MSDRDDDLRDHYDFRGGVRGKYADRFRADAAVLVLEPDLARQFKDAEAVDRALREFLAQRDSGTA